jgi:hypothetical protein
MHRSVCLFRKPVPDNSITCQACYAAQYSEIPQGDAALRVPGRCIPRYQVLCEA